MLSHALITLNQTAQILTIPFVEEKEYAFSLSISIQNLHSSHFVFLGDESVTTASYGFRLDPGQTFTADLSPEDDIYAVTDTGTTDIALIRINK